MGEEFHNGLPTRDVESLRLLHGVCSRDILTRKQVLDNAMKIFESWLDGYASPISYLATDNNSNQTNGHGVKDELQANCSNGFVVDFKDLIKDQMPDLLRLSLTSPFPDVRDTCCKILEDFEIRGHEVPRRSHLSASTFIPWAELTPIETEDDEVHSPFVDAFLHNNRLEHIVQVMGYHPQYLECFLKTQQYMLRGDGPLPYDYRHYIAIMAAGRHQCSYIINTQSTEFLLQHGDPRWLNGLDHVPKKLRDLYDFNKLMAHRPWLINKSHIEKLTRGNDTWSMSELMHAIILLAHFHALSSFVYGCGICAEIDHDDGHTFRPPSSGTSPVNGSPPQSNNQSTTPNSLEDCGRIEKLMERMRRLTEEVQDEVTEEELLQRFQHVESQSADLSLPAASHQPSPKADILRYVDEPEFTYQDFAKRASMAELPTFRAQDYSWDDHGFSLANRLYTDIGNLLDDKFKIAYNLTYYTMGDNHDVDTSSFRRAIWYYIHCMFGIRHDDYDYSEVNQLLERNLKAYVKTATCFPERVSKRDYDSFMREFKHSEKVHVNLMIFEAKLQAELLYALRAIMRHMT